MSVRYSNRMLRNQRRVSQQLAALFGMGAAALATAATPPLPQWRAVPENGNLPLTSARYSGSRDYGDLALQGYVEQEIFLSGKASVRNQETGAVEAADLPYTTRILVRRPLNPAAFSGNVIIEPFHAVMEKNDMWRQTHAFITRHGDVWIGVTVHGYSVDQEPTAQYLVGGVPVLKAYDAERYGELNLVADNKPVVGLPVNIPPQALDLMAQLAMLIKSNPPGSPLAGLTVRKLYTMGAGASGEIIVGFVRTGMNEMFTLPGDKPLFDGYLAGATVRFKTPAPKNAAFAVFRSEQEMDRAASWGYIDASPDTASSRTYNVPGTAHLGSRNRPDDSGSMRQLNAVLPREDLKLPYVIEPAACANVNDEPVDLFLTALLSRIEDWGTHGTPLPRAPLPDTLPGDAGAKLGDPSGAGTDNRPKVARLKRDAITGNVLGGVRLPWLEVPVAQYPLRGGGPPPGARGNGPQSMPVAGSPLPMQGVGVGAGTAGAEVSSGRQSGPAPTPTDAWPRETKEQNRAPIKGNNNNCFLFNPRLAYDTSKLRALYKGYEDYTRKFERAKRDAIKAGYLLPEDARRLQPRGNPADF